MDPSDIEQRVLAAVEATGEPFDVIEVDPRLADTAEFCAHYGFPLETSANCILVASRDETPVVAACLVLAPTRLDVNRRVRRLLGVRRLSFAPPDLTLEVTGMLIGGVTPFALPRTQPSDPDRSLPLWIDERVRAHDRVIVGGGSRSIKLSVTPTALEAVGGEFVTDLATDG